MTRTWKFTDIELVVLWEVAEDGSVPEPFTFLSRTRFRDDYRREKKETRERLRNRLAHHFDEALAAIIRPDIRVIATAADRRDPENPDTRVRVLGVRRGTSAYVVTQIPGETVWHSGGFIVTEHHDVALADAVVEVLPEVGGGNRGEVVLLTASDDDQVDYQYGRSKVLHPDDSVEGRSQQFLDATTERVGVIEICQGSSKFGPRGITRHKLGWRDLLDDGRYVVLPGHPPVARAVDAKGLVGVINTAIVDVIRAIREER